MERKSCCGGRSYVSTPCTKMPKKKQVVTPKKEELDVKQEMTKKETAEDFKGKSTCGARVVRSPKTEEKETASVKNEEPMLHVVVLVGLSLSVF